MQLTVFCLYFVLTDQADIPKKIHTENPVVGYSNFELSTNIL